MVEMLIYGYIRDDETRLTVYSHIRKAHWDPKLQLEARYFRFIYPAQVI